MFQNDFVELEALYQAARSLALDVYGEADRMAEAGTPLSELQVQRVRQVTTWVHGTCRDVVNQCFALVSSALRQPSVLGKYMADASVAAHHIIAGPMSLIEAAPPIIAHWAQSRDAAAAPAHS